MGAGIKIVLVTPEGFIIEQAFTLGFPTSNNEAEYASVLIGLRAAITLGVRGSELGARSLLRLLVGSQPSQQLGWWTTYNSFLN